MRKYNEENLLPHPLLSCKDKHKKRYPTISNSIKFSVVKLRFQYKTLRKWWNNSKIDQVLQFYYQNCQPEEYYTKFTPSNKPLSLLAIVDKL
jgi:hypothetical protein